MKSNLSLFDELKKSTDPLETYLSILNKKTINNYLLYSAILELTPVCNFDCQVCYIRMTYNEIVQNGKRLLRFEDWKYYIDGLVELGLFNITFTGGECTSHPDFCKIYEYAYDKKLQIIIMTNGSLITNEILDLFDQKPPARVYITLYGATKETYEVFCANGKAFNKVYDNINKLLSHKIIPILNYTCGKNNLKDLEKVYTFAKEKHLSIRPSSTLISYDKCDEQKRKKYEVVKEEYDRIKYKIIGYTNDVEDDCEFTSIIPDDNIHGKGITCNAGRNTCTINWEGKMKSCVTLDAFCIDPHDVGGIKECWNMLNKWTESVPMLIECQKCIFRYKCPHCIALHYNDTHEFGKVSPRLCFKIQHPEEAAKLQAEYDRRQALKKAEENAE